MEKLISDNNLGSNLKGFRDMRNFSQEELAHKAGYSNNSSISKLEGGQRSTDIEQVISLAEALGVHPIFLVSPKKYTKREIVYILAFHNILLKSDHPMLKVLESVLEQCEEWKEAIKQCD